jgi:hypothetical protein
MSLMRGGSVSGPIGSRNSPTVPGQPWVRISGKASGSGEQTRRKWIGLAVDLGRELRVGEQADREHEQPGRDRRSPTD